MGADASNVVEDASLTLGKIPFSSCVGFQPPFFYDNMIYKISVTSTSDGLKRYEIVVDSEKQTVDCNCKSGRIRGYCKHIRFYKRVIKDLLHENPGLGEEKGGK